MNFYLLFTLLVFCFISKQILPLNQENRCQKFHSGTFIYDSKFGEVIIVRNKTEDINYRIYPNSYIRTSIRWISPCVAEMRTIEINDTVFSEEEKKKDLNKQSKMYITQTFPDGYAYRIKEEKKQTIRIGKVKIYKGKLSGD